MTDTLISLYRGTAPLVVSLPHCGRALPGELRARLVDAALAVPDTDGHLERLYGFVRDAGASLIVPRLSRYVIDLNRPPEDAPMYPGANNTGLCPTRAFTGEPIYRPGQEPDAAEIARRRDAYWRPYHDALAAELERVRARHGHAVLFDGHSIKSELPWLFEGRLADLNLGSAGGASCAPSLRAALAGVLTAQARFSHVVDGRFKGGHITRHYGRPREGVHAVQLEMAWRCYCADEARPEDWSDAAAERVRPLLRTLVATMIGWKPA